MAGVVFSVPSYGCRAAYMGQTGYNCSGGRRVGDEARADPCSSIHLRIHKGVFIDFVVDVHVVLNAVSVGREERRIGGETSYLHYGLHGKVSCGAARIARLIDYLELQRIIAVLKAAYVPVADSAFSRTAFDRNIRGGTGRHGLGPAGNACSGAVVKLVASDPDVVHCFSFNRNNKPVAERTDGFHGTDCHGRARIRDPGLRQSPVNDKSAGGGSSLQLVILIQVSERCAYGIDAFRHAGSVDHYCFPAGDSGVERSQELSPFGFLYRVAQCLADNTAEYFVERRA